MIVLDQKLLKFAVLSLRDWSIELVTSRIEHRMHWIKEDDCKVNSIKIGRVILWLVTS